MCCTTKIEDKERCWQVGYERSGTIIWGDEFFTEDIAQEYAQIGNAMASRQEGRGKEIEVKYTVRKKLENL